MARPFFILSLLISSLFIPDRAGAKVIAEHVYLVPTPEADEKTLEYIKDNLPGSLPMSVKVMIDPRQNMPQDAHDPSRNQYNAETALDDIARRVTLVTVNERALIVTDVDLYAQDLNFVYGLSNAKKGVCIISSARLKNEFYGLKPDSKLFLARALKEAIHELGHSWGLIHCSNPKCVMFFSNAISDTDRKRSAFCRDCRDKLRRRYEQPLLGSSLIKGVM